MYYSLIVIDDKYFMEQKEKEMMHAGEHNMCEKDCGCHGKSGKEMMMSMHGYHKYMKMIWFVMMILITISLLKLAFGNDRRYDDMGRYNMMPYYVR